jgi:hypothetical protein
MYLHWSKKVAIGLLAGFGVGVALFLLPRAVSESPTTPSYMTIWIVLNYVGLLVWLFIWIADQARMRGKNIWVWLLPTVLAPLPTLMGFLIYLQKRMS